MQKIYKGKSELIALAGVTQRIECQPVNQRVAGSIPSQGTCLGCSSLLISPLIFFPISIKFSIISYSDLTSVLLFFVPGL